MTDTTTRPANPNAKYTLLSTEAVRRILRGLLVVSNANGLSLYDEDEGDPSKGEHVSRWWPTERCDDEQALALAYEAGAGKWHT